MIDRTQGTIVVFRILLLPPSETFIATQSAAMRQFSPFFVGWRRWAGIDLPQKARWTIDNGGPLGKLRELRFRYVGPTRAELARLRALDVRLVYAHFAPDGHAAMQLASQLDVPLVTALHGYDVTTNDQVMGETRLGREYLKGRQALQEKGALFVCCSEFIRQRALAMGYPADRTIVHAIGVDVERFKPAAVRERKNIVLFVGRMIEKKGCGSLIEAMAAVQRTHPGAELVLIGDGHLRAGYEALALERRVRCRFLGVQRSTVIRDWMARASVFCVPSVVAASGDAEGLGMVFIEAQAMGLPVVSTLSGGIPEAVKHGETGLLVTEHDSRGLSDAILLLMQDDELWQRYSLAGRRHVVDQFNLSKQTARLEQVFLQLLSRRYHSPPKVYPPKPAYDRKSWPHS
jgi:colanic acid/amylovoran biosynthesis glycosyltransferase